MHQLLISFEQAERINRFVDIIHSFFPTFSFLACFILLESFLPQKNRFESSWDKVLTYLRLPFLVVLNLTLISQGFFQGCLIYYPQTWFNRTFLGVEEPYEFGLFARHLVPEQFLWLLQAFYIFAAVVVVWRTWVFLKKRVWFRES